MPKSAKKSASKVNSTHAVATQTAEPTKNGKRDAVEIIDLETVSSKKQKIVTGGVVNAVEKKVNKKTQQKKINKQGNKSPESLEEEKEELEEEGSDDEEASEDNSEENSVRSDHHHHRKPLDTVMVKASSSGARGKRARRTDPAEQHAQRQAPARQIRYSAPLVVPPPDAHPVPPHLRALSDHTLLQFATDTIEYDHMITLVGLETIQHRGYDRVVIEQLGRVEEFDAMVTERWARLLRCEWPQFDELTVEFLSTFRYDTRSLTYAGAVSFALGRTTHNMSVAGFAVSMGIYSQEEVTSDEFEGLLKGVSRAARPGYVTEEEMAVYWRTIAVPPHTDRRLATQIRDPLLRYIHRILACSLIPRHSGKEKVSYFDLFCLYCIHGRHSANLATILLTSLARPRRGGHTARLDMGPYVSRMAHCLGVFDTFLPQLLTLGPETTPYTLHDMQTSGMVTFDTPPRWMPQLDDPDLPDPAPLVPPPSTHRILHRGERPARDEPSHQPAPPRLTLRYIHERMDLFEDILRLLAAANDVVVPPRMPAPRIPSDSDDGGDEE